MPVFKTYCCLNCKKEVTKANSREKFCSIQCQQDFSLNEKVKSGNASAKTLKRFLLKEYGNEVSGGAIAGDSFMMIISILFASLLANNNNTNTNIIIIVLGIYLIPYLIYTKA